MGKSSISITETLIQTITYSQPQGNNILKWPGSNNLYKVSSISITETLIQTITHSQPQSKFYQRQSNHHIQPASGEQQFKVVWLKQLVQSKFYQHYRDNQLVQSKFYQHYRDNHTNHHTQPASGEQQFKVAWLKQLVQSKFYQHYTADRNSLAQTTCTK